MLPNSLASHMTSSVFLFSFKFVVVVALFSFEKSLSLFEMSSASVIHIPQYCTVSTSFPGPFP